MLKGNFENMISSVDVKELPAEIIAPGLAQGELCYFDYRSNPENYKKISTPEEVCSEITRFEREIFSLIFELEGSAQELAEDSFLKEADIIKTYICILKDSEFNRRIHEKIRFDKLAAEIALEHVLKEIIEALEKTSDPYFSERSADFRDIELRLRKRLLREDSFISSQLLKNVKEPVVVVRELLISMVLQARAKNVSAFIIQQGTSVSHAAILAKSFNIPVLRLPSLEHLALKNNKRVIVDAVSGKVILDFAIDYSKFLTDSDQASKPDSVLKPLSVKLWLNVIDPLQAEGVDRRTVEGVGLYRTEFLFMQRRDRFPSEDEQVHAYRLFFDEFIDFPITIRTLDIGGDKQLPYFSLGPQDNPYLGLRAHRIYRFHPEIFITQMRAILRAGLKTKTLRMLYPMIETTDDLLFVKNLTRQAVKSLDSEGVDYRREFLEGILLEVPSAVWDLKQLLELVDFVSLGTNDLFQYFFALDRNNANVSQAFKLRHPVILRLFNDIVKIVINCNKDINICGEVASKISFLPILVGLGFDNLSIDVHSFIKVRKRLSLLDVAECKKLVQHCLKAKVVDEVKKVLDEFNSSFQESQVPNQNINADHIDPVCKMLVHREGNQWRLTRGKNKYYFCCRECRDQFMKKYK